VDDATVTGERRVSNYRDERPRDESAIAEHHRFAFTVGIPLQGGAANIRTRHSAPSAHKSPPDHNQGRKSTFLPADPGLHHGRRFARAELIELLQEEAD